LYYVEFASRALLMSGADPDDLSWTRTERRFDTYDQANEESFELGMGHGEFYFRVKEEIMENEYEAVVLDAQCGVCGSHLELAEGGRDHLVQCPVCNEEPAAGATPADALSNWLERQPGLYRPSDLAEPLPKHPWVVEVNGFPFDSLTEAEGYAQRSGHPIYCRLASSQKEAANG